MTILSLISPEGDMFVTQVCDDFRLLGKNSLEEIGLAAPAIVQRILFIHTAKKWIDVAMSLAGGAG